MKLYYSPGACSLSPHIVACEAGIALQLEKVDLKAKRTESGRDFVAINPKGYVPTLELDDGQVLTEGPAIVQYLADRKPESGLAPAAGTMGRYRLQEWLTYIGTELHKTYSPLFSPDTSDEVKQSRKDYLRRRYALVENTLAKQPFLLGEQFTAADAYLFTVTNWARLVHLDLADMPALHAFMQRVSERPGVRAALEAEGLLRKA
ncbi:glutathione transferase GstA [Aerosticca soli]|uniref:Glutathione S-transferase n=1 Tax=Aerosticca soli TaxID=2010829 RepID=A0A2Z6E2X8_9GAMM|nr:glutathione transferase GstA [Aerosticca soli]MDI3262684.1 glutathione transferase GstA [Fulvimonas sp.]BBD79307.1 glutathione S-transferase [Aerosticca soli]